jgi:hypothetical protein
VRAVGRRFSASPLRGTVSAATADSIDVRQTRTMKPGARKILIQVTNVLTVAAALAAATAMITMAGTLRFGHILFGAWVLLPFGITLWALNRRPVSVPVVLALLLSSCWALALYGELVFPVSRQRSTAGLAFIFVPLWHLMWALIALAISLGKSLFTQPGRCASCQRYLQPGATMCSDCAGARP